MDLQDEMETEFEALCEVVERIGEATSEMGSQIESRTSEIGSIDQAGSTAVARTALRRAIAKAAADMDKYVSRMDAELPLFGNHLRAGMSAFTKLVPIQMSLREEDGDSDDELHLGKTVRELRESMSSSVNGLESFELAVSSLPSMTTNMNRSRRKTSKVLQRWIKEIRGAQVELTEVENLINEYVRG